MLCTNCKYFVLYVLHARVKFGKEEQHTFIHIHPLNCFSSKEVAPDCKHICPTFRCQDLVHPHRHARDVMRSSVPALTFGRREHSSIMGVNITHLGCTRKLRWKIRCTFSSHWRATRTMRTQLEKACKLSHLANLKTRESSLGKPDDDCTVLVLRSFREWQSLR